MRRVANEVRRVGMNRYSGAILCILLLLFAVPTVNATITGWDCSDDGDGAIVMTPTAWTPNGGGDYTYSMSCAQHWYPGHLQGDFTTDALGDPTVGIIEDISNDTTFDWSDYHITIGMTQSFSFVPSYTVMPSGWTESFVAPVAGILPNTNNVSGYVGTVNYYIGTGDPVAMGDDGLFGFKISFTGSTNFTTEQIPTPEPTTIILLGLGAISVIRRKRA